MPQNPIRTDYTDRVFGRLTAKRFYCPDGSTKRHWVCECSCGAQVVVTANNLKSGNVRSCGCLRQDSARNAGARRVARMRNSLAAYARRNGVEPAALHYHVRKGRSKQEGVARILQNRNKQHRFSSKTP